MTTVFCVQDDGGTAAYLKLEADTVGDIRVGDTGTYAGVAFNGTTQGTDVDIAFFIADVHVAKSEFTVVAANANMADWPAGGLITWTAGDNAALSPDTSVVAEMFGANAYIDVAFMLSYHASRGNSFPVSPIDGIEQAIVKATDYLDQKFSFGGIKLLQSFGSNFLTQQNAVFLESWLTPYTLNSVAYLTPSTTTQTTEFPRQGLVDFNGDTVNGLPKALKQACAELALRVLNGVSLQPDYDSSIVGNGGVVSSITKKIGPIEKSITYDTKLGLGFFASFPHVDRLLSRSGLLKQGGGRTVIR
jgi:hypothetical protein